jgi:predicted NAD/FAD-binding protein
VWSSGRETAERYPAAYLFQFLNHHGMLAVTGGSKTYVDRAVKNLHAVHLSTAVRILRRTGDGVEIRDDADDVHTVAKVVIATHPDQALRLLADPTPAEAAVLGAIPYSVNETVLHTDTGLLPSTRAAYSSWNYLLPSCTRRSTPPSPPTPRPRPDGSADRAVVTYAMNQLHHLDAPVEYLVTMNAADRIDPAAVIDRMRYEHPVYTLESVAARSRLAELATDRTAFAGAYHGWGFHEDGCASGVAAAAAFGVTW